MTTLLKHKLHSIIAKVILSVKQTCITIKRHYVPIEEHQIEYTFNDALRHCPKNADEMALIHRTIKEMFKDVRDTSLFKSLIHEMCYANLPSCKTWSTGNIGTIPTYMDAPFSNIITECADRISTTYWVLWYDNRVEIVQPHQNRGIFRTGRESITINDKPDCMPENVISAAQVTLGVVQTKDNTLRGFQWKLYR